MKKTIKIITFLINNFKRKYFFKNILFILKRNIKTMGEVVKDAVRGIPLYMWLVLCLSALLLIAGFFVPPMGIIDGSVLKGVSILMGGSAIFGLLTNLPVYIEKGARVKAHLSASGFNVEVKKDDGKDDDDDFAITSEN